jgi:hypothetical protein
MKFKIYLRIEGRDFDPKEFVASLPPRIRGEVVYRRHNGAPLTQVPLEYWRGRQIETDGSEPESVLQELIGEITPYVTVLATKSETQITANLVAIYDENEEPRGFFFSRDIVGMLSAIRASLDVDVVPLVKLGP